MRALSEEMFEAAKVPDSIRQEYWTEFEQTKARLRKRQPSHPVGESYMMNVPQVLNVDQMRSFYGTFFDRSSRLKLDSSNVPKQLWPILSYAEFWGTADDWARDVLLNNASAEIKKNLKEVSGRQLQQ
jgi:hypothetical protein